MHLVDDEHAPLELQGRVLRVFDEITHVVDAVVARGVDLGDIRRALGNGGEACLALAAGFAVFGRETVDRACKNSRRCGFSRAARAAEEIGMRGPIRRNLILQCCGDVLLPDDLGKAGGTILAIERAVSHLGSQSQYMNSTIIIPYYMPSKKHKSLYASLCAA
ncbi:hypothetical protein SDC9_201643 [bioreactor metagenome]|uniref:Uncharacterized protein n=1 Tax=bioreactor metagenome TaxID=1076179 RepID=A0A645J0E2_9ZZZZ